MSDMDLVLHTDGPVIEFLADAWRNEENNNEFQHRIQSAVNWNNPWALLSMRLTVTCSCSGATPMGSGWPRGGAPACG